MRRRGLPILLAAWVLGCQGEHIGPGSPEPTPRAARAPETLGDTQILFGDLHTHTHFSLDAWAVNLPMIGGQGAHPPADACDFARFCSGLDFWSINDHAEGLTARHWQETREAIRACNAVTDPSNPDLVSFLGWEWSQVGTSADTHYGHKNVVVRATADADTPPRPIAAPRPEFRTSVVPPAARWLLPIVDFRNRDYYPNWSYRYEELAETPLCDPELPPADLPVNCHEIAPDPADLFRRLDAWGGEALVIPHGTTWGLMTPPGTEIASQLSRAQHDPARQSLFEIYSGHGSAEEYRTYRLAESREDGSLTCPAPQPDYVPCCWRAGEIIRERCEDAESEACEARVLQARQHFVDAGVGGYRTIPGVQPEDWLDCGQCRDCPLSAFDHRPTSSAQAALVAAAHDGSERRFRFGFLGSSDTHRARPGTGYKEFARTRMTDGMKKFGALLARDEEAAPESRAVVLSELPIADRRYIERQGSFYTTGGLVAALATGRTREAIWEALAERRVYGTSGPRILLHFELETRDGPAPMGAEREVAATPRFRVAATGARKQRPGCPADVEAALTPERIEALCAGECHNPGDERWRIEAIEVVRIRPQRHVDEPRRDLIDDPWLRLPCLDADGREGSVECEVRFEDPDFLGAGRETAYYVRALQEPTEAIGADPLRCTTDESGACVAVQPCALDDETEDCLAPVRERAWSSPIFVTPAGARSDRS